jgi:hypothetical protein
MPLSPSTVYERGVTCSTKSRATTIASASTWCSGISDLNRPKGTQANPVSLIIRGRTMVRWRGPATLEVLGAARPCCGRQRSLLTTRLYAHVARQLG